MFECESGTKHSNVNVVEHMFKFYSQYRLILHLFQGCSQEYNTNLSDKIQSEHIGINRETSAFAQPEKPKLHLVNFSRTSPKIRSWL